MILSLDKFDAGVFLFHFNVEMKFAFQIFDIDFHLFIKVMSFQSDFHLFHIHFQFDLITLPNSQSISFSNLLHTVFYCPSSSIHKPDKFERINIPVIYESTILPSLRD